MHVQRSYIWIENYVELTTAEKDIIVKKDILLREHKIFRLREKIINQNLFINLTLSITNKENTGLFSRTNTTFILSFNNNVCL